MSGGAGARLRTIAGAFGLAWRSGRRMAVGTAALAVVGGVAPVGVGLLTRDVVDRLAGARDPAYASLLLLATGLAAAGLAVAVVPHVVAHLDGVWSRAVNVRAQALLYAGAATRLAGLSRLEDPQFRDRLRLAEQAGRMAPTTIAVGGLEIARVVLTVGGFVVTLVAFNPWMVVLLVLVGIPAAYAQLALSRQRATVLWRVSPGERRQLFYAELLTGLEAAKEIRLLGLADLFGARMVAELTTINAEHHRLDRRELRVQVVLAVLTALASGAGLIWAVTAAAGGRITVGDVALFIAALAGVQGAIGTAVSRFAAIHQAALMFDHFRAVLAVEPDLDQPAVPRPVPPLATGIRLADVWFRYGPDQPWVLRGVDLEIPAGRTVALVGLNGAGKTTLVKMLLRFYDPTRGAVRWNGVDLRQLPVAEVRRRIGAVFQDYMCYDLSAAENIGVGAVDRIDDQALIERSARRSGAHDKLAGLPHGYATQLTRMFLDAADKDDTSTGVLLSGGQWQRVALARAFMRADRDLLIMDEPSAGLDAEAEADIHRRLRELRQGRTTLLISHRMSTVRDADHIVVLDAGRVVEQGTHDQLMSEAGAYARLFQLQAAGYQEAPAR